MIRRPPRSTQSRSSAASDVYKRQYLQKGFLSIAKCHDDLCRPSQRRLRNHSRKGTIADCIRSSETPTWMLCGGRAGSSEPGRSRWRGVALSRISWERTDSRDCLRRRSLWSSWTRWTPWNRSRRKRDRNRPSKTRSCRYRATVGCRRRPPLLRATGSHAPHPMREP